MTRTNIYYRIAGHLADRNIAFREEQLFAMLRIRRLSFKHQRLSEMSCNGKGWVNGRHYYAGAIDEYVKKQYGSNIRSAYTNPADPDTTVFDVETEKIEEKIRVIAAAAGITTDFQGDPRGYTVKLSYNGSDVSHLVFA